MRARLKCGWASPAPAMSSDSDRIASIEIDNPGVVRYHPDVEREIQVSIYDLTENNSFAPDPAEFGDVPVGPYALVLRAKGRRLLLDIATQSGDTVGQMPLPLAPFRRTIKDYFTICESYYEAIRVASPSQIEVIDIGRRVLHNEGSDKLREILTGKIELDHQTARRLFTLLCALQFRA